MVQTHPRPIRVLIAKAAADEDVDVVGLSILSGAHNTLIPRIVAELRGADMADVLVVVGGTIPEQDVAFLHEQGVEGVFGPGTPLSEAIDFIRAHAPVREEQL